MTAMQRLLHVGFEASLHLLDDLVDAEARRPLARRIVLECSEEFSRHGRCGEEDSSAVGHQPVVVGVRGNIGSLVGVRPKVEQLRDPQARERFRPDPHRSLRALLLEDDFPILVAKRHQVAIVVEIEESISGALGLPAGEVGQLVVAIEMNLEGLRTGLMALEQLLLDIRITAAAKNVGIQSSPLTISLEIEPG